MGCYCRPGLPQGSLVIGLHLRHAGVCCDLPVFIMISSHSNGVLTVEGGLQCSDR